LVLKAPVGPARAYLLSSIPRSRQTMASFLGIVAGMLGAASLESCSWGSLRRHHVMAVTELPRDTGRATATVVTYLSALKGVAKEALDAETHGRRELPAHPGGT
jgi:hypothetical protein